MRTYKDKLDKPLRLHSKELKGVYFSNEWISIVNGYVTVQKGYSWNGCTFAPDTKETYAASCVHDAMYQFKINREVSDNAFYELLKQHGFRYAKIYYISVRLFGFLFY